MIFGNKSLDNSGPRCDVEICRHCDVVFSSLFPVKRICSIDILYNINIFRYFLFSDLSLLAKEI